jgi:hypothetical protein
MRKIVTDLVQLIIRFVHFKRDFSVQNALAVQAVKYETKALGFQNNQSFQTMYIY